MHAALVSLCASWMVLAAPESSSSGVPVESVLITLIEHAVVPAQESGVVSQIKVREGQQVKRGELLLQLDETDARLTADAAKTQFEIARKVGSNDVKVRFTQKSHELARAELRRANESIEKFKKSVSQAELEELQLSVDKAVLEIEQAQHDLAMEKLTAKLRENELQLAESSLARRQILSPIDGVVVELRRRLGEFVETGDPVARILRMDRLRAEGFVQARQISGRMVGSGVTIRLELGGGRVELPGTLVFISPEVNPVNGQVRVWAEFDNRDSLVRPGLQATMVIQATR